MILTRQEVRAHAGHLVICGFDGTQLDAELKEILREVNPLGLILFSRNIESAEQVAELNREIKHHCSKERLLLCVDQEGGRVARVRKPLTEWPPMRLVGQLNDAALVKRLGQALARELRGLHFDVDFAPVLDVDTNPANPVIGDRAFSSDPDVVARLGVALIEGLQGEGVAACGKHFPGHGDTALDSHLALPFVGHELRRMQEIEWKPFAAAIRAGVSSIMTAHVVAEALDDIPATLSPRVLKTHLRQALGFQGAIVSDDIEMKAVADRYSPEEMALLGLQAGVDIFLACHAPATTLALYRGLVQAVEQESVSHQDLDDAARRALALRDRYYRPPAAAPARPRIAWEEHAEITQEIMRRVG